MTVYRVVRRKPVEPPVLPGPHGDLSGGRTLRVTGGTGRFLYSTSTFLMAGDQHFPDGLYRQNQDGSIEAIPAVPGRRAGATVEGQAMAVTSDGSLRPTFTRDTSPIVGVAIDLDEIVDRHRSPRVTKPAVPERPAKTLWEHLDEE
jgi:hypothetical protein